jgi:hypothetical protein
MTIARFFAAAVLLGLATPSPGQTSTKVESVDQVPHVIRNKDGLATFHEQMSGAPALPDEFGTSLPPGLSAKTVVAMVAPGRDAALATLVGVKAWPYQADTWIAIACLASDRAHFQQDMSYSSGKPVCQADSEGGGEGDYTPKEVHLAVLGYRPPDQAPRLLASYGKPLDVKIGWQETSMEGPMWNDNGGPIAPYAYLRFDFAPYRISATQTAFGVRVSWSESYAGGGADFIGILLFSQDGDRLRNILAEPIYYMKNLAGDWHEDGTRSHDIEEGQATIMMLPHQTHGHFDLRISTSQPKSRLDFAWDDADGRYVLPGQKGMR